MKKKGARIKILGKHRSNFFSFVQAYEKFTTLSAVLQTNKLLEGQIYNTHNTHTKRRGVG